MKSLVLISGAGLAVAMGAAGEVQVPWWGQILIAASGAITTALIGLGARALNKLFDKLAAETNIKELAEVDELISGFVAELIQTEVQALKEVAKDGKLSPDDIQRLKEIPKQKLLAVKGEKHIKKLLGSGADTFISSRVEKAVLQLKSAKKENR